MCNRFFGARAFLSGQYEAVEIDEFVNAMKLNERITTGNIYPIQAMLIKILSKQRTVIM